MYGKRVSLGRPPGFSDLSALSICCILTLNLLTYTYQGNPPVTKNLLQHYGEIMMNEVRQKAMTYLGLSNRNNQDSNMMYITALLFCMAA
jgi:hypothetical protein